MSVAEQVAAEQNSDNKKCAESGAKLLSKLVKEIRNGLNPDKAMEDIMNAANDELNLALSECQKNGNLSEQEVADIKEKIKPLNSRKDLEDGCYKAGAKQNISQKLKAFNAGEISKDDLMKGIDNCVKAPDSIRMNTVGSKDLESIKAEVSNLAQKNGTLLNKETLNIARKQMKKEAAAALKKGTKSAAAAVGKGSASVALGASTCGIGFVVQLVKELLSAAKKTIEKTAKIDKDSIELSRGR